jgi:predicted nucleotidyltransferase
MSGITAIDILIEHASSRKRYVDDVWTYLEKIKHTCRSLEPDCRVIVFGSLVKGRMRIDSDIDVLIVSRSAHDPFFRGKLFREIVKEIGLDNPFEFHIVTDHEFREIYLKFLDIYHEI